MVEITKKSELQGIIKQYDDMTERMLDLSQVFLDKGLTDEAKIEWSGLSAARRILKPYVSAYKNYVA